MIINVILMYKKERIMNPMKIFRVAKKFNDHCHP